MNYENDGGQDSYGEAFDRLVGQYYETEGVRERLEILEQAAGLADSVGDIVGGYNLRLEMIQVGTFAGQKDKALVAFSWCLAKSDENPEQFDGSELLWKYKWVLENLPTFVQIPKEKIYELQEDMQHRLNEYGYNLRPIHFLRWTNAMRMGDFERAKEYHGQWLDTSRDAMADCEACEQNKLSELYGRLGDLEKSAKVAAALIEGRMTCAEVPHLTYGHLAMTYLELRRIEDAKQMVSSGYRMVQDNDELLEPASQHLSVLAVSGQLAEAIPVIERHAKPAHETPSDHNRWAFYEATALALTQLVKQELEVRLRLPSEMPCANPDNRYSTSELANWFHQEAEQLSKAFDTRNGNDYYASNRRRLHAQAE